MPIIDISAVSHLSILESVKDAVIASDLTGKIFFVNKAVEKLFGYKGNHISVSCKMQPAGFKRLLKICCHFPACNRRKRFLKAPI